MKYAIMSDVHANPRALEAALADARAQKCEKFVFAGDVTGYGYDVNAALRLVRENFDVALMGNHDSVCAEIWEMTAKGVFRPKLEKRFARPATKAESVSFKLGAGSRYIVNVGSVGNPRNDLCASYAIYDADAERVTIRRLSFDFKGYITEMLAHGIDLPSWLCDLLQKSKEQ